MARIIVFKKLSLKEATDLMVKVEDFFQKNKSRRICRTDLFEIRRGYTATDILKHTEEVI